MCCAAYSVLFTKKYFDVAVLARVTFKCTTHSCIHNVLSRKIILSISVRGVSLGCHEIFVPFEVNIDNAMSVLGLELFYRNKVGPWYDF